MATLTIQNITLSGLTPSFVSAASGGDEFSNNGRTFIYIKNANGATARQVTVTSQTNCNQGFTHDVAVSVPASSEELIGPFANSRFNVAGVTSVSYDDETDLTIAAIQLGA